MKFKRIYVEITNHCNLNCSFCSDSKRAHHIMSAEAFNHIAGQLKEHTDYIYLHVKGEPLSHPELSTILDHCHHHQLQVNLTTNGTLLKQKQDVLLASAALRQINISLHSIFEQPPTSQKHYLENVIGFTKTAAKRYYVSLRLWNGINHQYDLSTKKLIQYLCDAFSTDDCTPDSPSHKSLTLAPNVFLSFEEQFIWPSLDHTIVSSLGTCYGLRTQLAILANGEVVPCCLDGEGVNVLGNIFQENLSDILMTPTALAIRNGFLNRQLVSQLCQRCRFCTRFS